MTEAYNLGDKIVDYYGKSDTIVDQIGSISHMPLFFDMITKFKPTGADSFDKKSGSEIVELVSNAHGTIDRRKHFLRQKSIMRRLSNIRFIFLIIGQKYY